MAAKRGECELQDVVLFTGDLLSESSRSLAEETGNLHLHHDEPGRPRQDVIDAFDER
jgi:hypothetical protein